MRAAMVVLAAGLVAGCSVGADLKLGEKGIAAFHQEMNAGQLDRIYDESSPEMKATGSKPRMLQFLTAVHGKLGAFKSGSVSGFNDNVSSSGHRLVMGYKAQYEKGVAAETFTFRIEGDRALLVGYNVNSDALILQ